MNPAQVLVRVRPLNEDETSDETSITINSASSLSVTHTSEKKSFQCSFDAVLGPSSSQAEVYSTLRGCTQSVLEGINSTIFAYGQTGSGKTYSMYGPSAHESAIRSMPQEDRLAGIIPRAIREIFEHSTKPRVLQFSVYCSFVQIYNENLYDMLRDSSMSSPLSIREDGKEVYVEGLSEYNVKSVTDTLKLLKISEENRVIRETHMNLFSSRSHSLFQVRSHSVDRSKRMIKNNLRYILSKR